jgi:hypothetical protein
MLARSAHRITASGYTDGRLNAIGGYMTLEIAMEMAEALTTDNLMSITTLGEYGDEVARLLYEEVVRLSNGMANNKFDLTTPTDCSNAFGCPHFINGKPSF